MYARSAATMLPFGRRSARAASMSAVLASVTFMNASRCPAWSSATCAFTPPFVRRNFAHGNIDRHRSIAVESSEYSGFLKESVPPRRRSAAHQQRPEQVPAQFPRLLRVHPRQRRPRHLADAQVARLARLRRQVRHDVPKAAPPRQLRHPHRHELAPPRQVARLPPRPVLPRQPSNSCLGTSLSRCPNIVLLCATAWIPCVSIGFRQTQSYRTGRSKPPLLRVNGTAVQCEYLAISTR